MQIIDKSNYDEYLNDNGISALWRERDFVPEIKKYMDSSLSKVLIISGLRGTGKSVGVLQAIRDRDAVYIIMEQGICTSADDLLTVLKNRKEKILFIMAKIPSEIIYYKWSNMEKDKK